MNKSVNISDLNRICVFDIETVGQRIDIENNPVLREFLAKKYKLEVEQITNESLLQQGGLYPETGKIICISAGLFKDDNFYVKSYYGDDEKDFIIRFCQFDKQTGFYV